MTNWRAFTRDLSKLREQQVRPVLVLGSGLLHQTGFGRAADWTALLKHTARSLKVRFNLKAAQEFPTLYWDALVREARDLSPRKFQSNREAEDAAQRAVKEFVERSLPDSSRRSDLGARLLKSEVFSIVSLNFTLGPFMPQRCHRIRSSNQLLGVDVGRKRVWLPHGWCASSQSLRLGVRAYRLVLQSMEEERRFAKASEAGRGAKHCSMLKDCLKAPIVFAGCGLRDVEWTMYWLLATKARAATSASPSHKSWFLTDKKLPTARIALLKALDCHVIREPCHTEYWEGLCKALEPLQSVDP